MKKLLIFLLAFALLLSFSACANNDTDNSTTKADAPPLCSSPIIGVSLHAKVIEVYGDTSFLVEPLIDSEGNPTVGGRIQVSLLEAPTQTPVVGDIIQIFYDGMIAETYPPQIHADRILIAEQGIVNQ